MELFTVIEGAQAILIQKGVWRQVPLYERAGRIFAKWGQGYISLRKDGVTTGPSVRWEAIDIDHVFNPVGIMYRDTIQTLGVRRIA